MLSMQEKTQHFPWIGSIYSQMCEKFRKETVNSSNYFQELFKNITTELQRIATDEDFDRCEKLHIVLNDFVYHFHLKAGSKLLPFRLRLVSYMVDLCIFMSKNDPSSSWLEHATRALILYLGDNSNLMWDAVLCCCFMKKKYSQSCSIILKRILQNKWQKIEDPAQYMKFLYLFRKLKIFSPNRKDKSEVLISASKVKPPAEIILWLSSLQIENLQDIIAGKSGKKIAKIFICHKFPNSFFIELKKVLLKDLDEKCGILTEEEIKEEEAPPEELFCIDNSQNKNLDSSEMLYHRNDDSSYLKENVSSSNKNGEDNTAKTCEVEFIGAFNPSNEILPTCEFKTQSSETSTEKDFLDEIASCNITEEERPKSCKKSPRKEKSFNTNEKKKSYSEKNLNVVQDIDTFSLSDEKLILLSDSDSSSVCEVDANEFSLFTHSKNISDEIIEKNVNSNEVSLEINVESNKSPLKKHDQNKANEVINENVNSNEVSLELVDSNEVSLEIVDSNELSVCKDDENKFNEVNNENLNSNEVSLELNVESNKSPLRKHDQNKSDEVINENENSNEVSLEGNAESNESSLMKYDENKSDEFMSKIVSSDEVLLEMVDSNESSFKEDDKNKSDENMNKNVNSEKELLEMVDLNKSSLVKHTDKSNEVNNKNINSNEVSLEGYVESNESSLMKDDENKSDEFMNKIVSSDEVLLEMVDSNESSFKEDDKNKLDEDMNKNVNSEKELLDVVDLNESSLMKHKNKSNEDIQENAKSNNVSVVSAIKTPSPPNLFAPQTQIPKRKSNITSSSEKSSKKPKFLDLLLSDDDDFEDNPVKKSNSRGNLDLSLQVPVDQKLFSSTQNDALVEQVSNDESPQCGTDSIANVSKSPLRTPKSPKKDTPIKSPPKPVEENTYSNTQNNTIDQILKDALSQFQNDSDVNVIEEAPLKCAKASNTCTSINTPLPNENDDSNIQRDQISDYNLSQCEDDSRKILKSPIKKLRSSKRIANIDSPLKHATETARIDTKSCTINDHDLNEKSETGSILNIIESPLKILSSSGRGNTMNVNSLKSIEENISSNIQKGDSSLKFLEEKLVPGENDSKEKFESPLRKVRSSQRVASMSTSKLENDHSNISTRSRKQNVGQSSKDSETSIFEIKDENCNSMLEQVSSEVKSDYDLEFHSPDSSDCEGSEMSTSEKANDVNFVHGKKKENKENENTELLEDFSKCHTPSKETHQKILHYLEELGSDSDIPSSQISEPCSPNSKPSSRASSRASASKSSDSDDFQKPPKNTQSVIKEQNISTTKASKRKVASMESPLKRLRSSKRIANIDSPLKHATGTVKTNTKNNATNIKGSNEESETGSILNVFESPLKKLRSSKGDHTIKGNSLQTIEENVDSNIEKDVSSYRFLEEELVSHENDSREKFETPLRKVRSSQRVASMSSSKLDKAHSNTATQSSKRNIGQSIKDSVKSFSTIKDENCDSTLKQVSSEVKSDCDLEFHSPDTSDCEASEMSTSEIKHDINFVDVKKKAIREKRNTKLPQEDFSKCVTPNEEPHKKTLNNLEDLHSDSDLPCSQISEPCSPNSKTFSQASSRPNASKSSDSDDFQKPPKNTQSVTKEQNRSTRKATKRNVTSSSTITPRSQRKQAPEKTGSSIEASSDSKRMLRFKAEIETGYNLRVRKPLNTPSK